MTGHPAVYNSNLLPGISGIYLLCYIVQDDNVTPEYPTQNVRIYECNNNYYVIYLYCIIINDTDVVL